MGFDSDRLPTIRDDPTKMKTNPEKTLNEIEARVDQVAAAVRVIKRWQ